MNSTQEEKLKQLASELAKDLKTGADLSALSGKLVKLTVEAALSAKIEQHLGSPKAFSNRSSHGQLSQRNHGENFER